MTELEHHGVGMSVSVEMGMRRPGAFLCFLLCLFVFNEPSSTLATASMFYVRSGSLAYGPWLTRPVGRGPASLGTDYAVLSKSRGVKESRINVVEPVEPKKRLQLPGASEPELAARLRRPSGAFTSSYSGIQ